jgi:hypothetical protein
MEEVRLGLSGMAWNCESRSLPDGNGLEWRKSVLASLLAWNQGSQFWPDWNG